MTAYAAAITIGGMLAALVAFTLVVIVGGGVTLALRRYSRARLRQARRVGARSQDRSYRAFLVAIRSQPGLALKLLSLVCFSLGLLTSKGLSTTAITLGGTTAACLTLGYAYWRRWGP